MPDTKISALPTVLGANIGDSDYFPINVASVTSRVLVSEFKTKIFASPVAGTATFTNLTATGQTILNGVGGLTIDSTTNRWDLVRTGLYPSLDFNTASGNIFRFLTAAGAPAPVSMGAVTMGSLTVAGAAGINGKAAVANVAAPTAAGATYTATEQTLLNDIRTRLINFGIYT